MSKVVRLQTDAIETALNYGNTVSEGIRTMDKMLKRQQKPVDMAEIREIIREELEALGRY